MEELIVEHRTRELAGLEEEKRRVRDEQKEEALRVLAVRPLELQEQRTVDRWRIEMMVSERELSLTQRGSPEAIIEELDPPFVERLEIEAPQSSVESIRASVRMSRTEGCTVEVRGRDLAWVRSARTALTDEITRGVPWWAWLRSVWAAAICASALYIAFVIGGWEFMRYEYDNGTTRPFPQSLIQVLTLALIIVGMLSIGLNSIFGRVVQGLEILPPGATAKSGRAIGIVGSLGASFVIGILVNIMTR
jgi:hypothetical protein